MCFESQSRKTQAKGNVNFASKDRPICPPNPQDNPCYDFVFTVNSDRVDPILVNDFLDEVSVSMELDTGAVCSLIPKTKYEKLWPVISKRPKLYSSSAMLKVYGGSSLKVLGEIFVTAKVKDNFIMEKL